MHIKINSTFIDNAEDLDNNLLEYSDNNSMTSGSLLNYYRYEVNDDKNENDSKFVIRKWNIVNDQ